MGDASERVIIWGIGNLYQKHREYLKREYPEAFIWDRRLEGGEREYDGYRVLCPAEADGNTRYRVILCMIDERETEKIAASLDSLRFSAVRLTDIIPVDRVLTAEEINRGLHSNDGKYADIYGNIIECGYMDVPDLISIRFSGRGGRISFGKNVRAFHRLEIECGNDCSVVIGDDTTFDDVTIYSAYADVNIGKDCMFSYGVYVRNHDSHFIYELSTGDRINYSRDITIGDHVWVGQNSLLLSGFSIGTGSVVGAGAVSSSGFGDNEVIAGNPARVIREGVQWTRGMTWTNDHSNIREEKPFGL